MQYLLRQHGQTVSLTGTFDEQTDRAVRALQASRQLVVDGIVGEQTWLALIVEIDAGDQGPAVSAAQYLLRERFGQNLDITGIFGPTTRARVEEVQADVCLGQTGVVGRYTWHALIAQHSYCDGDPTGPAAQRILAYHRAGELTLWDQTFGRFDGADPLSNITAAAAGRPARTSCHGGAPCNTVMLSNGLLNGMARLHEDYDFGYFVTAIAGAAHSATSYHYAGRAVDIGTINGVVVRGDSATSRAFMSACRALGAIEVLGPSNDANHQDHVHCAW